MNNNKFNLPDFCFAEDLMNPGKVILINYGQSGYCKTDYTGDAMKLNEKINVTWAQMQGMINGSMFGWDIPGINPEYFENLPNKSK